MYMHEASLWFQKEPLGDISSKERRRRINRQSAKRCRKKEQDHYLKLRQVTLEHFYFISFLFFCHKKTARFLHTHVTIKHSINYIL